MEQYVRGAAPSADEENRRALVTMFRQSASPGLGGGAQTNELGDRRSPRAFGRPRPVARPEPLGGVSFHRQRLPLRGREHSGSEAGRAARCRPRSLRRAARAHARCNRGVPPGGVGRSHASTTSPTVCSRRSSSRTSSGRPRRRSSSATRVGARLSKLTMLSFAGSSAVFGGESSTRRATGSSPRSTARHARSAAPARSPRASESSVWRSAPAFMRASARSSTARWAASPSTSGRASHRTPRPERSSSRAR